MIKEIMRDPMFLALKSKDASKEDIKVVQDLKDTIEHYKDQCVGMAANMIGIQKRIIIFYCEEIKAYQVMLNPTIMKTSGKPFHVMEGCLSLEGERQTKRFPRIKVQYQDCDMKIKMKSYDGFSAQIIQHEIDHCNGIII